MQVTIGGNRLGSGGKQETQLKNYSRSTHDLSYIWRSTMAPGTLVPFMSELALPGDTFDIKLNADMLSHPTIGPLFGSFKIQLDCFQIPIRLYQASLHMNMLGIGMNMSAVKLPQVILNANDITKTNTPDNQQINPSCIFRYLGISGLGQRQTPASNTYFSRAFNAVPYLGYWDIYKNYYANKQETNGVVIHTPLTITPVGVTSTTTVKTVPDAQTIPSVASTKINITLTSLTQFVINCTNLPATINQNNLFFMYGKAPGDGPSDQYYRWNEIFKNIVIDDANQRIILSNPYDKYWNKNFPIYSVFYVPSKLDNPNNDQNVQLGTFPLTNIDKMRKDILGAVNQTSNFEITKDTYEPYGWPMKVLLDTTVTPNTHYHGMMQNQEGLAIKTYQSDLFNNWINTDWIDNPSTGISAITAVNTEDGYFTIDTLNLSKKVYDMLNRIAITGGTYDDWLDAVYTHERTRSAENPMYIGGLIKNMIFQEVVSNSSAPTSGGNIQPLGTLAGRGRVGNTDKGGTVVVKVDEPSYIMGIISLTPIIDYSQGNKWDTRLQTMNDLHKPALDEIGFQNLTTEQMAYWDASYNSTYSYGVMSAGKQPAWINYMTNVNRVLGNFADQSQQMYMTLNRRYELKVNNTYGVTSSIKDLTTYIDPSKFNHIFADTRRDAQNFWAQIGVNITARRKMSAKVIPNL